MHDVLDVQFALKRFGVVLHHLKDEVAPIPVALVTASCFRVGSAGGGQQVPKCFNNLPASKDWGGERGHFLAPF